MGSPVVLPPSIPVLETDRLRLRGHALEDFAESAAMWSDDEVVRYIGRKPSTPEEAWARMLRSVGQWALTGYGAWVVEEKATGRFVGEVGICDFHRETTPPLPAPMEAGWVVARHAQGKGYGTEAVRAALAWIDGCAPVGGVACIIEPPNTASVRVAEKCGFRPAAPVTYKGDPFLVFVR